MANRNTTYEEVQEYFDTCKAYWMRIGNTEGVATCKAFWWDCVEVWNMDDSWNEDKEKFARDFRGYRKGDPVPDAAVVEEGGC